MIRRLALCCRVSRRGLLGLDGSHKTAGEVGELHVRGRNADARLVSGAGSDREGDRSGWLVQHRRSGPLRGDCLFIVGRTKEMIIRSGFNVYPAEIEAVLSTHASVVRVCGRGAPGGR